MHEIELKFAVEDHTAVQARLHEIGANETSQQNHVDTYFNHPCRNFAETTEALRVRVVDGVPKVTYKGAKMKGSGAAGAAKARLELEFDLNETDNDGENMQSLLHHLGFVLVGQVKKHRRTFQWPITSTPESASSAKAASTFATEVTLDAVDQLGTFIEIETLVDPSPSQESTAAATGESEIEAAREHLLRVAQTLGLGDPEPRSYLRLMLEKTA